MAKKRKAGDGNDTTAVLLDAIESSARSIPDIAAAAGVSFQKIYDYRAGRRNASRTTLESVADELGLRWTLRPMKPPASSLKKKRARRKKSV